MRNYFYYLIITLFALSNSSAQLLPVDNSEKNIETAKHFIKLLETEKFNDAYAMFDSTVKKMLPEEKLGTVWNSINSQFGKYSSIIKDSVVDNPPVSIVILTAKFGENYMDVQITINQKDEVAGFYMVPNNKFTTYNPPAYIDKSKFEEKDVNIGEDKWMLPGTLSLPKGPGDFPVVILVHGSGPNDRDETVGPNKPFRDLAWGLASKGIAVLRYEKRTKEHSKEIMDSINTLTVREETTDDVLRAAKMLRKLAGIDNNKIFVLGHSLGAMMIPRIATEDKSLAGFIVMAGPASPLEDIVLEQYQYIFSADSTIDANEKAILDTLRMQIINVKSPDLKPDTPSDRLVLNLPASYWLDLRNYNPPKIAKELNKPFLVLHGQRDYQVSEREFALWEKDLSGKKNFEFRDYPKLNHLFIEGAGKRVPKEYFKEGHIPAYVIEDIEKWIRNN